MSTSDFREDAEVNASSAEEGGGFEAPPTPDDESQASSADSGFDAPPLGDDDDGDGGDASSQAADQRIEDARGLIEQRLAEAASAESMTLAGARNVDSPGVLGVGVSDGVIPGQRSLVVFVESDAAEDKVRREIVDTMGVRAASSDDLPVEVVVTGSIEAQTTNRSKFRPTPAGVSVGHFRITAGTIGGWARGRGNRARRLLMLSNNHVLAESNRGRFGDSIIQPGRADGGVNPRDRVAILERFVRIQFGGAPNFVDCATGWCWPNLVRRDHVFHGPTARFLKIGNAILEPRVGMMVGKTGRTTNLTRGLIRATGVSINVNFGSAGVAHFRDQFAVRSVTSSNFSAGGDSGSVVWQWARGLRPVGLLFAGGGGTTFCNRLSRVVAALDITMFEAT